MNYENNKSNKLRYIAYVRKSTEDEERQVLSKQAQKEKIKERFPQLNIIMFLDESKSAFEPDKRPVFKRIIEMLDNGKADGIVAWHPDRLSRNEQDAAAFTYRIRRGIIKDLGFANYSFDNSPEGIMMLQLTMSQSQYFSAKLSKDVRRGNEQKRKNGGLTGCAHLKVI
jgi:site-specific DNA recombinase